MTNHIFFRTAVLRKLFDIRFSYNHCNFSHVCLLVKMVSKTVTRSILKGTNALRLKRKREEMVMMARRLVETVTSIQAPVVQKLDYKRYPPCQIIYCATDKC